MPTDDQPVTQPSNTNRNIWVVIIVLLLLLLGWLAYLYFNRQSEQAGDTSGTSNKNTGDFLYRNQQATTGELTVNGAGEINGDLHVTGNLTVDGTINGLTNSNSNTSNNSYYTGCVAQVICNSTLLQASKTFVIQPSSPYVVGGTIRGAEGQAVDLLQLQNASGYSMVNVTSNGQLGVNNPTPTTTLDVNGTGHFYGHTATGNVSAIDNPSILTPLTGTPIIRVQGTQEVVTSLTPGYDYYTGSSSEYFVNLGQSASTQYFTGGYHAGEIMSGNPQSYYALAGDAGLAIHEGTGNISIMAGLLGYTFNNSSGHIGSGAGTFGYLNNNANGTMDKAIGAGGAIANADSGAITNAYGLNGSIYNGPVFTPPGGTGTITNADGLFVEVHNKSNGNITNASGVYVATPTNTGAGSIINVNGVYIEDQSGVGTTISNNIYSAGANSTNVLDGAVSISSTNFGTNSKLIINHNPALGFETTDNAAVTQINVDGTNTALVLQGKAFSSGSLQQWQSFNGTVKSVVDQSGAFGIGTSSITHELTVTDTSTTNVAKFNGSGGTQCTVVTGTGWSCSSDETLKTNILSINNGLDIIKQIQGVTYNWRADPSGTQQDGFIAQDIQKILPELVTTDSNGKLSLNKDGIMPFIVEAVKEQNGQLDQINVQLSEQGIKIDNLSTELKALAARVDSLEASDKTQNIKLQQLEDEIKQLKNAAASSTTPQTTTP